jgi:hypothetical protein
LAQPPRTPTSSEMLSRIRQIAPTSAEPVSVPP